MSETRIQQIRRRHRPGYDPRWHGRDKQCVRCHTPWPCDAIYVSDLLETAETSLREELEAAYGGRPPR